MSEDARNAVIELIQKKYGTLMRKIAREILDDWQFTEDVTQEVLWKLISQHRDRAELPPDQLKNYLCTAVKNTAVNMAKQTGRLKEREERWLNQRPLTMDAVDMEAFRDQYGFGPDVEEILRGLDNVDRDILGLMYGQGFSRKETAEIVGLSDEAVKKRLQRAKVKIKAAVEKEGGRRNG